MVNTTTFTPCAVVPASTHGKFVHMRDARPKSEKKKNRRRSDVPTSEKKGRQKANGIDDNPKEFSVAKAFSTAAFSSPRNKQQHSSPRSPFAAPCQRQLHEPHSIEATKPIRALRMKSAQSSPPFLDCSPAFLGCFLGLSSFLDTALQG